MQYGVSFHEKLEPEDIRSAGFHWTEIRWDRKVESDLPVSGIVIPLQEAEAQMSQLLSRVQKLQAHYLVIETAGCDSLDVMEQLIGSCADMIRENAVPIYIENGFAGDEISGYRHCDYSEAEVLRQIADYGNEKTGTTLFGVCINIGYGNLLAQDVRGMLDVTAEYLKLVHVNDNDGFHNVKQMPYTFTQGRGSQTTDWEHIMGAMIRSGFDGWFIFDTDGLFGRTPGQLEKQMLKLLYAMAEDWQTMFHYEDFLAEGNRKIILFGTGRMAAGYMHTWGRKFPPVFLVDNNTDLWGKEKYGLPVKAPEAILEIPEEERRVLLCSGFYREIGAQLTSMGIPYTRYSDQYFECVM